MSNNPDRYEVKSGGGCMALFGLPFFFAGLAIIAGGFSGSFRDGNTGESAPVFVVVLFGAIFTSVGAAFVFGRRGVFFDKRTGMATSWWGLLIPFKKTEHRLDSLKRVALSSEIRRNKNSTYTVYPVRVEHSGKAIHISEPKDSQKARTKAEEVAKFLNLPLADSTAGTVKVRAADELDQSIREQVQKKGETIEVSAPPVDCRIRHRLTEGKLTLEIPKVGVPGIAVAIVLPIVLLPLGFAAFFASSFLGDFKDAPLLFKVFAGVFVSLFILPVALVLGRFFLRSQSAEHVTVTPDQLELKLVSPMGARVKSIPADELEEFDLQSNPGAAVASNGQPVPPFVQSIVGFLGGGGAMIARSDRQTLTFGTGLTEEEARWMHSLIKRVLTS